MRHSTYQFVLPASLPCLEGARHHESLKYRRLSQTASIGLVERYHADDGVGLRDRDVLRVTDAPRISTLVSYLEARKGQWRPVNGVEPVTSYTFCLHTSGDSEQQFGLNYGYLETEVGGRDFWMPLTDSEMSELSAIFGVSPEFFKVSRWQKK